jgi:hypothetical protein
VMKGLAPALTLLVLLGLCACGSVARPGAAAPSPLSPADLQYRLVDRVGSPLFCDPSQGPVLRSEDPADVARRVAALRAQSPDEFAAIVRHEHLNAASLSPADEQRVLDEAGRLDAVKLTPRGSGYAFAYELVGPPTVEVTGTISSAGAISVASRQPAPRRLCPLV